MTKTATTARVYDAIPNDIDPFTVLPAVTLRANQLRAGHLLLDPELGTPSYTIDHRTRAPRNSGQLTFLAFDHETNRYEQLMFSPAAEVPVAAR